MSLASAVKSLDAERPVLIAGPTGSGKSALALEICAAQGGQIVNADALQVFANWRVLTARPSPQDEAAAPHALYGHVAADQAYSVGHWLRDIAPLLAAHPRPVIVGGTGLNFTALTEGLAQIPPVPPEIRGRSEAIPLADKIAQLDAQSAARIDLANPARVSRAWEVLQATGRGIADWQESTPAPLLPLEQVQPIVIDAPKDWLTPRLATRFDRMLKTGALDEVRANLAHWDPALPSSRAIGAPELIAHLQGQMTLDEARDAAVIATRQYAKRQRTWFKARMSGWRRLSFAR